MKESTLSTRIPRELEKELEEYLEREDLDRSLAVRKLLKVALKGWRVEKALELLEKGDISFTKAAKLAELDVWSFADEIQRSGIIWVKEDPEKMREELRRL